jgi:hypothetical protein
LSYSSLLIAITPLISCVEKDEQCAYLLGGVSAISLAAQQNSALELMQGTQFAIMLY